MLLKQTGWVPIGTFLTFGSLFIFQGESRFSLHIYSFENCYWSPIWFRRFLSFWYVLHICRDLFCVTLVKFEFFDQQFSCLSHLLLDIDNEISIAVIEVKPCPTLGCFGQYSDFYFPLAWENMQLKIQNVPTIQAINGALFKPFSVKPFLLVYFYISFYWALWQFYSLANRSKQGVQNGHMKAKTSGNLCTNLSSSSTGHKARITASPVNKEIRQEIQS